MMGAKQVTRSATKEEMIARIARLEALLDAAAACSYIGSSAAMREIVMLATRREPTDG